MSTELIIIGVTGDGKNVAEITEDIGDEWNLLGYLDDDPNKQGVEINGYPVLGTVEDINKYKNCYFIVTMGTLNKKRVVNRLGISINNYATIIHPSARVSKYVNIGKGSVVYPGVTIMVNVQIGKHTFIASQTNIGHDTIICDYVSISSSAAMAGNIKIGEGCFIGLNASIKDGVTVGKWSIIGMGSVVIHDVPAYHVVAGNPARVIRVLEPSKLI